ncbi:MAG TPA: hypothetical protein VGB77_19850 [Abditibacteriaceae bacterium]|jgi:hypothetical protein
MQTPVVPQVNSQAAPYRSFALALLSALCVLIFPFLPMAGLLSYEKPGVGRGTLTVTADGFDAKLFDIWQPLTYWQSGLREFWFMLPLLFLAICFNGLRNYRAMLWVTFGCWVVSYLALQNMLDALLGRSRALIAQVLPPMVANAYGPEVRPLWGWLVLLGGLILLFSSALVGLRQTAQSGPALDRATITDGFSAVNSRAKTRFARKTPEILAVAGNCGILYFLFFPSQGFYQSAVNSIYMVRGDGHKWGLLLLPPLIYFFVRRREVKKGLMACGALALMVIIAFGLHLLRLVPPASVPDFVMSDYRSSTSLQWLTLFSGTLLLCAATLWESAQKQGYFQSRPAHTDNGPCPVCGTINPLSFTKCHKCFNPLPWVKMPKVKKPKAPRAARSGPNMISNFAGSIDWSWWLILLISFAAWPVGMLLWFAYTRTDDDKGSAAAIGTCSFLGLFILRLWWMMYKASQPGMP